VTAIFSKPTRSKTRPFWQGCWSARSVVVVEVNGYTIEPGANLEGANFAGASLTRANLEGAWLKGANLKGARASESTTWPEGFDPVAAGVIFN